MERDARYAAVAVFALAVIASAFAFVWWYSGKGDRRSYEPYEIYFEGSVSGLSQGSPVRYLGVDVGRVQNLAVDRRDPGRVKVIAEVDSARRRAGPARRAVRLRVPEAQHDPMATAKLLDLLIGGYVEVHRAAEAFSVAGRDYPAGTYVVPMAQPFRAYAKTLLERQDYPVRKLAPDGPVERPYAVAGWTLPLQMGVTVDTGAAPFDLPAMSRLSASAVTPAQVWGDRRPSHYIVDGRGVAGALAANRLLAAGLSPSWLLDPFDAQGYRYEAGALVVKHSRDARAAVDRVTRELGLRAVALRGRMPARTRLSGTMPCSTQEREVASAPMIVLLILICGCVRNG